MKQIKVKVEGSGTINQVAIRLLELGRKLQLTEDEEFEEFESEDSILFIECDEE